MKSATNVLVENISLLLTMAPDMDQSEGELPPILGGIPDAVLAVVDGQVAYAGPGDELPQDVKKKIGGNRFDAEDRIVMPGLVECHTHLVWGGDRFQDFADRCAGKTYEAIAERGGGILSTVEATRETSLEELAEVGMERLDELLDQGVTTVEIKSGYGLDVKNELKILRAIDKLSQDHELDVVPTFLGAHVVAPEFNGNGDAYIDMLISELLPEVKYHSLARFCDVFVEKGAFTPEQGAKLLKKALELGLKPKVHAEQLSASGGAALAAKVGAVSADHLDWLDEAGAKALAKAGTVGVLLPGATMYLGKTRYPQAELLRKAGVPIALSTDYNPGSSMTSNLFLMGTLGCVQCGLLPEEALRAITTGAAQALGLEKTIGALKPGMQADFILVNATSWIEPLAHFGTNKIETVFKRGRQII